MGKSLEFCKARASDPSVSTFADRNWNNAEEVNSKGFFDEYCLGGIREYELNLELTDGSKILLTIDLEFNEDADYDYFTSSCRAYDGTLIPVKDAMMECVTQVIGGSSYNKDVGKPQPGDKIKYIIGNFVVLNEFDETAFATKEKPWLCERTTVLLPLKMMKGSFYV